MLSTLVVSLAAVLGSAAGAPPPPPLKTIPFRAVGSTVLLPVSVNGREPGWFILDTGANSCVLDKAFSRQIGLRPTAGGEATGAGKGTVPYERYQEQVRFTIGELAFECPEHTIGLDLGSQPGVIGAKVDGILGTDFFSAYTVEIDYARRVVRAYDPKAFGYSGRGARIPVTISSRRLPYLDVRVTVDGSLTATRSLLLDTGSQDAVDDDWVLRSRDLRTATGGVGLGQTFEARSGRFSDVRIGPFRLDNVPAFAGGVPLVGGEALRHFTMILDWPKKELILEPNAGFARDLVDSGVAGFALRANADGTATIHSVSAGAPAARAGFAAGDRISRIDGTPAAAFEFPQLQELFRRDRSYRIEVVRDGKSVTLTLGL